MTEIAKFTEVINDSHKLHQARKDLGDLVMNAIVNPEKLTIDEHAELEERRREDAEALINANAQILPNQIMQ